MSMTSLALAALIFCSLLMGFSWWSARRLDNYSIVDAVWSLSFAILAPVIAALSAGHPLRRLVIATCVLVWSLRLGIHLTTRIFGHLEKEDTRYQELRREYGNRVAFRFFLFYQMQAVSIPILLLPALIISANAEEIAHPLEFLGVAVFLIGWIGESIADQQLKRFVRNPDNRGQVCQVGLWNYSRHPNYFFEAMIWLGLGIFALPSPNGIYAWISVAVIWILLLKVTGVPYAEKQSLKSKGDLYREYQRTTNAFFPGPKKRPSSDNPRRAPSE